jgi:hypothetical protein
MAVFVIHVFRTSKTIDAKLEANVVALSNFLLLLQREMANRMEAINFTMPTSSALSPSSNARLEEARKCDAISRFSLGRLAPKY